MRNIFKGFSVESVKIDYTTGGAGKGKNKGELIFKN